ncbi:MAG: hypothetical protein KAI83_05475 [Thiomargarita sp.]|nr:hypothetical protein [Thiomargarita sp.]
MKNTESIFGFLNPKENTLKRFQTLHDVLAKEKARLELGICGIQNESIQYRCSFDVQTLLNWQRQSLGGLGIAFFRPSPLFLPQYGVMPLFSIGHLAVTCLGVIDNLPEIREKLISDGHLFYTQNNMAETLSLLFHHYFEYDSLSPIDAMQKMMTKLKGQFAFMALVTEGKWLMVGCRDYPLAVGKMRNDETIYFCTDRKTLAQFSPSISLVFGSPKPMIFCGTPLQSDIEIFSPDSL